MARRKSDAMKLWWLKRNPTARWKKQLSIVHFKGHYRLNIPVDVLNALKSSTYPVVDGDYVCIYCEGKCYDCYFKFARGRCVIEKDGWENLVIDSGLEPGICYEFKVFGKECKEGIYSIFMSRVSGNGSNNVGSVKYETSNEGGDQRSGKMFGADVQSNENVTVEKDYMIIGCSGGWRSAPYLKVLVPSNVGEILTKQPLGVKFGDIVKLVYKGTFYDGKFIVEHGQLMITPYNDWNALHRRFGEM